MGPEALLVAHMSSATSLRDVARDNGADELRRAWGMGGHLGSGMMDSVRTGRRGGTHEVPELQVSVISPMCLLVRYEFMNVLQLFDEQDNAIHSNIFSRTCG